MKLRGSVTVFVSIILSALILFSGTVIDLARFRAGETHARAAVQLAVQSALARYFSPLKENYGLWASAHSKEELEMLIYDLIEKNLGTENTFIPGITDLFGFSVDSVTVYPVFNLTDAQVLEKEIADFMKYRAPVNTAGLFLEKLKAFNLFLAQSGLLNKRMELEDNLQKIREKQVYLSLILSERIPRFVNGQKPEKGINDSLLHISSLLYEINDMEKQNGVLDRAYLSIPSSIEEINEAENEIENIEEEISDLEKEIEYLEDRLKDCEDEAEIAGITDEIQKIERKISQKSDEKAEAKKVLESAKRKLKSEIDTCVGLLNEIAVKTERVQEKITQIKNSVGKFVKYHEESVKLSSDILKQCYEIKHLSEEINTEIKRQAEKSDNAFLVKIKSDMKQLVLTADPEAVSSIKTDLEVNLTALNETYSVLSHAASRLEEILDEILRFIYSTERIYVTLEYTERKVFGTGIEQCVKELESKINSAVSGYKVRSLQLEPDINAKEKNEFYRWCNKVFDEKNETENKDKGYEKKLRNNIKKADESGKKENEMSFNGKDKKLSSKELEELFKSLPSKKNNETGGALTENYENTEPEEKYKKSLNSNADISFKIGSILDNLGESVLKSLYINEYIVSAFKNANIDKVSAPRINIHGGPAKTFFEKAEVEYIIFGNKKEKTNADLAQASIFGIRMGLNLLHVYMDSKKVSAAMSAAVSIAGWSGFGVPIVKNLILLGWAAGESYLDLKDINDGKDVAVYKTENTWKLSLASLFSDITGKFLEDTSVWLKKTKDEWVDKADDAVKTLIRELVTGKVNEVFAPIEQAVTEAGDEEDNAGDVKFAVSLPLDDVSNVDDLKEWVVKVCQDQYRQAKNSVTHWTGARLEHFKKKAIDEITNFIINSPAYENIFSTVKKGLNNIIDGSLDMLSESLQQIGNQIGDPGMQSQLVGTVVSFDYVDYLRLLLVAVPNKTKLLRAADIIQLNMRETLDNPDFLMSEYNSFIIVEAEISMKTMFIPSFLKTPQTGKFSIRWGYGY
ncbi:viral A-type inclusion repeat-containing protein [Thermoclostridium stercorarium subsp. stercorarium DSM 8532]|uniref:Viral A-type inclusion repeat-containing protein n=4 Tax=Thermoclostridium stercorarium TaxID=1510 RepID=L7VPQ2_THES1|nr:DUF5702 domain-containing protein [Thermoclostridium stercorarium]AGC68426.1 viral A-type inclusion repeat-containing protein [Thermoclostridium stercorarium subsp. stercorarium DSM 8532]AGI39446.1 hypothetical protein Clst_1386 [Thermoclostridium stercorarium subsp. stercorarium DSM 8532]ANW98798.1 hypothetical protein CSTERTH_07045 [Thermoclostridium stercorarium subsp. thermolacticum DSM 2910]ANX01300.1 hypothetical protein CSTERLE_06820 [Thermoclostridium stercorarium subsp. leptospartum